MSVGGHRVGRSIVAAAAALLAVSLVLAVGAASTASAQSGASGASVPSWLTDYANKLMTPGVEQALVFVSDKGHQVFASAGSPLPTIDERFLIASVTKGFTATIVLQLVQEKKLKLNGTLGHYLPRVMQHGSSITIRELLQHRSGLRDMFMDPAVSQMLSAEPPTMSRLGLLREIGKLPLAFRPGSRWKYSNTDYFALGLIIEKVTRHSYAQQLSSRIFKPLGLHATSPASGDFWRFAWAAGGLISDVQDVARFYQALLSGRLLSKQTLAQMEQTDPGGASGFFWATGFTTAGNTYVGDGLGIFATDAPCGRFWGHGGNTGVIGNDGWITSASVGAADGRAVIAAVRVQAAELNAGTQVWNKADPRPVFCSSF